MSFEIIKKYDEKENRIKLYPMGDLDIYTAPDFKTDIMDMYKKHRASIIMDAAELDYVDSTGLGALLYILKEVHDDGNVIEIENLKKNIVKLFTITKLDEMFVIRGAENE